MKPTRAAPLVVMLTLLAACGDDDNSLPVIPDGSALDGAADTTPTGGWPGTCDPVQQNCPAGQQCIGGCNVVGVMAKVFTCATPAAGATATNGQDCGAGCAAGHDCYVVPTAEGGTRSVCRKYCNVDADCAGAACVAEGLVCSSGDTAPIGRLCAL
jgi:hypothetical protein